MGYIGTGMCHSKGYAFSPVLIIKIGTSVIIGYGFCTLLLSWVWFVEEAIFSSLIRPPTKALHSTVPSTSV